MVNCLQVWLNEDESWRELQLSLAFDRQLSSTLIDFELVHIFMICARLTSQLLSTLTSFDLRMRVDRLTRCLGQSVDMVSRLNIRN